MLTFQMRKRNMAIQRGDGLSDHAGVDKAVQTKQHRDAAFLHSADEAERIFHDIPGTTSAPVNLRSNSDTTLPNQLRETG